MNAVLRSTAVVSSVAASVYVANLIPKSKGEIVHWGIIGELDQMNTLVEFGRKIGTPAEESKRVEQWHHG